jgi:MFS family permease
MKEFKKLNNILGWIAFAIATLVYFLTLEPTASWWDCGEYIATAYKLQVGHPPGAPTFQMIGRFFSLFAFGDTSKVALMINAMSALCSSFTILFLFWTITMLARKLFPSPEEMDRGKMLAILGSGFVGAMAFTFSDSFWFSAVEGEVYAMSSLFTAITFWAILKWDSVADEEHSFRWIIFIVFLIGISIGIHLLNLLAIPAVAFVYYFRKYKATTRGMLVTGGISILLLAVIMYVIIPGIVWLSGMFELFFVNNLGLPFNSGTIFYFVLLVALLVFGLRYTRKHKMIIVNTIILGLVFLLIGYSSFLMLVIRSNANVPIDENNPEDAVSLLSYLNREQYGSYPLFYGQYYNAPIVDYGDGTPVRVRDDEAGEYVITDDRSGTVPIYNNDFQTIFPRMWSSQKQAHVDLYKQYGRIQGTPITINRNTGETVRRGAGGGNTEIRYRPTFIENLRFFFSYQVDHMYIRYFLWNFVGRQNDIESQGEVEHGNWLSGISFIDNWRLGNQSELPISRQNAAHNKFYFLPLILGLIGFFYHLQKSKKDSLVVGLLFLMTGLAIVIYLNQYPLQPRERDYAFAGSFYAFAIWIGLGVLGIYETVVKKFKNGQVAAIGITLTALLLVPGIMAQQGWDDHDRSGKYAARDFAINYLNSCQPDAVLVTFGDNDTFPLWYSQEVEGVRTDLRVVNHMLASGSWYVQQLFRKAYDSDPVPFTLTSEQYEKGVNEYIPIYDRNLKGHTELKDLVDFIASDRDQTKLPLQSGRKINYIPTRKVRLTVDSAKCVDNGIVPPELADKIEPYIEWEITQNALFKNDLALLDFLATNDWERPLYVANPNSLREVLNLDRYFHQVGMVYKFMPVEATNYMSGIGGVYGKGSYDILADNCKWGNLHRPDVTVDRESARNSRLPKQNYLRAAETLLQEGEPEKAITLLDTCLYYFPHEKFTYDFLIVPFAEIYFEAGADEKGMKVLEESANVFMDDMRYFNSLRPSFLEKHFMSDFNLTRSVLTSLRKLARDEGNEELANQIDQAIFTPQDQME